MTLHILSDENIPAVEHFLGDSGVVRRLRGRDMRAADLDGVDVLLVRSVTQVDEALLAGSAVQFVGTATSGVDHIDRDYLDQQGIGFAHAPGSNANSVVEYVLAAIAAVPGKLEQLLAGGSVGIVGYGHIGSMLSARLRALGIEHRVYDPWLDQQLVSQPATLAEVLACDVVTLHPELTREQPWPSFHLLGEGELACLDSNCLLINASRGAVLDNQALLGLLLAGRGPVSVLDVWEGEPALDHELLAQVRLGTPHIAGYSLDGKLLATRMLCEALGPRLGLAPPRTDSPAGEPAVLAVPDALEGAPLARYLLAARYVIATDDALLRESTLGVDTKTAARAFDLLRKNYGARRELLGSLVLEEGLSPQAMAMVRGFGCGLTERGSDA